MNTAWFHAVQRSTVYVLALVLTPVLWAQGLSTTTVQGTMYLANGQPGAGTLVVSWPAFTSAAGQVVAADSMTVTIPADGFINVNLAPNQGATPAGQYYTAVFYMSDGSTSTQYWVVPEAAQATLAQVQAQVMPAAEAVQAVTKAYVDQSIAQLSQDLVSSGGGTMTGPLFLNSDPTQPMQAADKHYVDDAFANAVPITGGTMSGILNGTSASFSGTVAAANGFHGTVQDNGGQVYDVRAFGAKCDGVTDDSAAFQAAIAAMEGTSGTSKATNSTVFVPAGSCVVHGLVLAKWGDEIKGAGRDLTYLVNTQTSGPMLTISRSPNDLEHIALSDLTIKNTVNRTTGGDFLIYGDWVTFLNLDKVILDGGGDRVDFMHIDSLYNASFKSVHFENVKGICLETAANKYQADTIEFDDVVWEGCTIAGSFSWQPAFDSALQGTAGSLYSWSDINNLRFNSSKVWSYNNTAGSYTNYGYYAQTTTTAATTAGNTITVANPANFVAGNYAVFDGSYAAGIGYNLTTPYAYITNVSGDTITFDQPVTVPSGAQVFSGTFGFILGWVQNPTWSNVQLEGANVGVYSHYSFNPIFQNGSITNVPFPFVMNNNFAYANVSNSLLAMYASPTQGVGNAAKFFSVYSGSTSATNSFYATDNRIATADTGYLSYTTSYSNPTGLVNTVSGDAPVGLARYQGSWWDFSTGNIYTATPGLESDGTGTYGSMENLTIANFNTSQTLTLNEPWSVNGSCTESSGTITCNSSSGTSGNAINFPTPSISAGNVYKVTYTVTMTSGTIYSDLSSSTSPTVEGVNHSTPGTFTYTDTFTAPSGSSRLGISVYNGFNGTISNVTVLLATGGQINTPAIDIAGGTPITSQSSANSQVVTCPAGGTSAEYCGADGAWHTVSTSGYSVLCSVAGLTDTVTAATAYAGTGNMAAFASNCAIPASTITSTTILRVSIAGVLSTSASSVPNMTAALDIGSTQVWKGNTGLTPTASLSNNSFSAEFLIHGTASPASAANVITNPLFTNATSAYGQPFTTGAFNPEASLATNGSLVIQPYLYASSGTTGNSATITQFLVEVVHP